MSSAPSRVAPVIAAVIIAAAVALSALAGGAAPVGSRPSLAAALGVLPESTTVVGFTDWRAAQDGRSAVEAQQRDLLTRSVVGDFAPEILAPLGVTPRDLQWEVLGRGRTVKVDVVRLERGHAPSPRRLMRAGYRNVSGVWISDKSSAAQGSMWGAFAWVPHRRLIVGSSRSESVRASLDVIHGRAPSLVADPAIRDVAQPLMGSTAVLIEPGPVGCLETRADVTPDAGAQADAAQERVGALARYRALGRGLADLPRRDATQRFVISMPFASARKAAAQARIRADLSQGAFIGGLGTFSEVLRLRSARADGTTATLVYDHPVNSAVLMTGRGPLLPASC